VSPYLKVICWCSYLLRLINVMHGGYVFFLPFFFFFFFFFFFLGGGGGGGVYLFKFLWYLFFYCGGVGGRELNDMNMYSKLFCEACMQ
jgi:hypothetical protein